MPNGADFRTNLDFIGAYANAIADTELGIVRGNLSRPRTRHGVNASTART